MGAAERPAARLPFHGVVAGLTVRSEILLPGVAPGPPVERPDVDVRVGALPPGPGGRGRRVRAVEADGEIRLYWAGIGAMSVRGGVEVVVSPAEGVEAGVMAPVVLGIGMGLLLHQRGHLVLHASAVGLPGGAVAFVGEKGAGKSTLAGAFLARGHPLLTDDVLPLALDPPGPPRALPGPTPLKLWPEAARALGLAPKDLPRLFPRGSKRVLAVDAPPEPAPLRALYALAVGDVLAVEPVSGRLAMIELVRHAYVPRFVPGVGATPEHFGRIARVAGAVPLFRLVRPAGLARLPDLVAAVEAHAATLGPAPGD